MTTCPELPRFEIPEKESAPPPRAGVWAWMQANLLRVRQDGALPRIKRQVSRTPVDRRFELHSAGD